MFAGSPSEQISTTERNRKRRHSLGTYGYHPTQSQGHIKAATLARAVQKATHNQRFCLGVISPTPVYNRTPSKHPARLHFKDSQCRLQFMYGLSNFGVFANFVLHSLQQIMSSSNMLCCLSRAGVRFGFALRLHDTHLSGRILVLASGSWTRKIQIADSDVPATLKLNQERGLKFVLPASPNEVVMRP